MSDTDDTDALLTCDPSGGLQNLLGKTMEGISTSQLDTQSFDTSNLSEQNSSLLLLQDSKTKKNGDHNNESSNLEISDFFNSEGELVLTGLSQLSDMSDSDSHVTETKDESSIENANNEDGDDEGESDSSVETNTVVHSLSKSTNVNNKPSNNSECVKEVNVNEKSADALKPNDSITQVNKNLNSSFKSKIDSSASVPEEIQADLKRQLLHANRKNPGFQNWLDSGTSQVTYGVLNLNLNDLNTFAEGLCHTNIGNIFTPPPKVSTFVPTTNEKGEQIFTRAPNFRTPGGYKPPKNPKTCRDLTDDQIREEVRKMYAFPDAKDEEDNVNKKQNKTKCYVKKRSTEKNSNNEEESKDKETGTDSSSTVTKLQHDQKVLAAACKHSRERISQYEKELHKTVELADSFKSKLVDVQTERDESVQSLKRTNSELEERIAKLKEDMEMLRNERDATLRALRESQIRLDEGKLSFEKMEAHLKALEEKGNESCQKYAELLQAKSQQDSSYMEVVARQKELETLVMNLTMELNTEKSSKDQLKRDMQDEAERKTRAEAERLHEYYNKKVQDILKSATEEAARAESVLKDQIKRASVESERKLAECKERFQREMDIMKAKYEAEIERLKRENLHKQLLISSTVKQLQMGDSPNLEINSLNMPSRTPYQKEKFDILKSQFSKDSCGSHSKSGYSQFTKFTLDHMPQSVTVPSAHHSTENTQESTKGLYEDLPFEAGKILARFKTSTPVDSHIPSRNHNDGAATGDSRSGKSLTSGRGDAPSTLLEKVRGDKIVSNNSSSSTESKNLFSHSLEAPVKPEKEQHQMKYVCSNDKHPEAALDPTLQKCIQDLLKNYADKFQSEVRNGSSESTDVPANNNAQDYMNDFNNKNEGGSSSCNNDNDRLPCSSTSESHTNSSSSRSESRKTKEKVEINNSKIQPPSQGKPPWK